MGAVRHGVPHKKGAIRKESTNPEHEICGDSHRNQSSHKDIVRYRIKCLGNVEKNNGKSRSLRQGGLDVRDEAKKMIFRGILGAKTSLEGGQEVSGGDKVK